MSRETLKVKGQIDRERDRERERERERERDIRRENIGLIKGKREV